ncbi:hypothetical protein KSC_034550 [Ktedonobacter sp. SOSP1-52]|nr:hypothetical protein KSC_034550 [Ktedonobacter sp. SOSP1-52]
MVRGEQALEHTFLTTWRLGKTCLLATLFIHAPIKIIRAKFAERRPKQFFLHYWFVVVLYNLPLKYSRAYIRRVTQETLKSRSM